MKETFSGGIPAAEVEHQGGTPPTERPQESRSHLVGGQRWSDMRAERSVHGEPSADPPQKSQGCKPGCGASCVHCNKTKAQ